MNTELIGMAEPPSAGLTKYVPVMVNVSLIPKPL